MDQRQEEEYFQQDHAFPSSYQNLLKTTKQLDLKAKAWEPEDVHITL